MMMLSLWGSLILGSLSVAAADERPNILFVLTDDQGYGDLACHGHPFIKTPNVDKLYAQSMRFTNYHASPTCAPTRAALMSGLDAFRGGVTHTILERERLTLKVKTVADLLQSAGYATGAFGKWHLGDADEYQPDQRGFDEVFIHGAGGIGQSFPGTQGAVPGTGYFDPIIKHNGTFVKTTGYCTDVFFQQTLGWINQQRKAKKPFFAYLATNAPHGPFIVADKYKDMYREKTKPTAENPSKKELREGELAASFLGMCTNIDENMGLVMTKLDEWGIAENTILIYSTDNGSSKGDKIFNANMRGGKGSTNEGGSRVPFIMRWPKVVKQGVDNNALTRHFDVLPTFVEIAGAELPKEYTVTGRSLYPLIKNPKAQWADRNLFFNPGRWGRKDAPPKWSKQKSDPEDFKWKHFAVRNTRWRLVNKGKLYDIQKDPSETTNVIDQHPDVAAEMLKEYDTWWQSMKPFWVNENAPLNTGKPFIELFNTQEKATGIPKWTAPTLD